MVKRVCAVYFSPTGHVKKSVMGLARALSQELGGIELGIRDFTLPKGRTENLSYGEGDLVILGVPVIAGRVPNVLLDYLRETRGRGALGVPVVVYGNRHFDDALVELQDLMEAGGIKTISGGAFVGEHSFSTILGAGRPDEKDEVLLKVWGKELADRIRKGGEIQTVELPGERPYRWYYQPKDREGHPIDIRKVKPKTSDACINCKLCVKVCPLGSIFEGDVRKFVHFCMKCNACVKKCPVGAKYFDDPGYLTHKLELEEDQIARKEPGYWIG